MQSGTRGWPQVGFGVHVRADGGSEAATKIGGTAETAIYNGGALWSEYWIETITELRGDLISSGKLDEALIARFLAYCADSNWWTQTIAFTAVHGRTPGD